MTGHGLLQLHTEVIIFVITSVCYAVRTFGINNTASVDLGNSIILKNVGLLH